MKTLRWIAFLFFVLTTNAVYAQWLYTDLHPTWSNYSCVMGVSAGDQVGYAMDSSGYTHGLRWQFAPGTVTDLGGAGSYGWATDGIKQVGRKGSAATRWLNTPNSALPLRSPRYASSPMATSIFGNSYGGYAWISAPRSTAAYKALYWSSPTANPVVLPIPNQFDGSSLYAMNSDYKVGNISYYESGGYTAVNAAVWEGPSNNVINVHPYGYYISTIRGISENIGVGWASENEYLEAGHATVWDLWSGYSYSIHPWEHLSSVLWGISGDTAAGSFMDYNGNRHAAIWDVNSGTYTDLHQFLPGHYSSSEARAIWVGSGCGGQQVGGWAFSEIDQKTHAILWYTPWC
jgi:hypothetical protein